MSRRSRRRDPGGEEPAPVPLGDALAEVGAQLGLPDAGALRELTGRWREIVGETVAEHARLRSVRGGVLTIAVDAAPWATELRYQESALRDRVSAIVGSGVVREVRVVVDPRPAPEP